MKRTLNWKPFFHGACAAVLCLSGSAGYAADAAEPPPGWETTASVNATLTRGNSETFLGTVSLDTKRLWPKDEIALGISAGYGEAKVDGKNDKNTEFVKGFGQYNRLFSDRFYGGLRLDGEYDGIAGVDYRVRISPLLGYYVIKSPRTSLALEAGPSVVFEKLVGKSSDEYFGARFGERFEHKLTDTTKIWQSFEYIPDVGDWADKYLLNAEVGIASDITKKMSLRLVLQDNYNSMPSAGRKHNDLRLLAGIGYKF